MGRREELSDFQRGTIVGCHMCKKSVRQISDLLSLPRSTVCAVILKWKHGGVTSARPRSGRPHKLKKEDRQVLEKVALESCLRSVEAVATEFQSVSGASVSPRTVRRELREMGFRGRVSTYKKTRGRLFQSVGALTENALSPLVLSRVLGTANRALPEDLRLRLGLPHSTVVREIMHWCRGGITPFRPKGDSWFKQRKEKLAQIALEKSLSSVEAAAIVSTDHETRGEEMAEREQAPLSQDKAEVDVSCLELRVGQVISAVQLPETDGLYVLQVDAGEASQRTVVHEMAKHIPLDQMHNRMVVLLCNLKPAEIGGVLSQAEILCAHSPSKVEILDPPSGAVSGDRVTIQGFPGEPDKELNPKQKVWEQVQADLHTDPQCVATYKGVAFEVIGKGVCRAQTLSNTEIK